MHVGGSSVRGRACLSCGSMLAALGVYSASAVTLGSRYNIEKSKSGHFELEFEGPARVFKLEGDTHEIATAFDSSVTEGGVRGKSCAARPLRGSVILESVVLRIQLFEPQRGQ